MSLSGASYERARLGQLEDPDAPTCSQVSLSVTLAPGSRVADTECALSLAVAPRYATNSTQLDA